MVPNRRCHDRIEEEGKKFNGNEIMRRIFKKG